MERSTRIATDSSLKELPWIAAFALGFLAWTALAVASNGREAWDSPLYFALVLPVLSASAGLAGWCTPTRAWCIAPALAAGQFVGLVVQTRSIGNLWPLTLIVFSSLHVPALLLSLFGRSLRRRATR